MPRGIKDSNSPRRRIIQARETAATEAAKNLSLERKKAASERAKRIASWEAKNKNISKKKTSSPKLFKTLKSKKGLLAGLNALPVGQEEAAPVLGRSSSLSSLVSEPALLEEYPEVSPTASPRLASPGIINAPIRTSLSRSPRRSPRRSRSRSRSRSPVLRRNSSVNSVLAAARARIAEVSAQREALELEEARIAAEARAAEEAVRLQAINDISRSSSAASSAASSSSRRSNRTLPPSPTPSERYWATIEEERAARVAERELRDPWHHPYQRPPSLNIPADPDLPDYIDIVPPDYEDIAQDEAYNLRVKKRKDKAWRRRHPFLNLIGKKRKGSPIDPVPEYYPPIRLPEYTVDLPPRHRTQFVPPQGGKRMKKKTRKNRKHARKNKHLTRRRRN